MRHRLAVVPAVLLVLTGLSACGGGNDTAGDGSDTSSPASTALDGVQVTGNFAQQPKITVEKGFDLTKTVSDTVIEGDGPTVEAGKQVLLQLDIYNASTGKEAYSSFGQPAQPATVSPGQLPGGLDKALTGQKRGSRVINAGTVKDLVGPQGAAQVGLGAGDDVIFVVDILSVQPSEVLSGPEGTKNDVPALFPTLQTQGQDITGFDFSKAPKTPSKKLEVATLIEGTGPAIPADQARLATIDYVGQVYGQKKPFDNSYVQGAPVTFPIENGSLIKAWDQALAGVKAGSRIVMTIPPELGYGAQGNPQIKVTGKSTLVFVIDVLGVDA